MSPTPSLWAARSYARARGESVAILCNKGVLQRAERLLLIGFGAILAPSVGARAGWEEGTVLLGVMAVVAVGTLGTAVYRTVWIARRLPFLDNEAGGAVDQPTRVTSDE